ncbi:MAG: type II toxin-antitoxin system VapC family toxin, partial [Candidatus Hydrogenedentes bacterium]|nr:type II toxin-antitoxin system VapC family toxin [Candidatus Hydrogenedentota bacterium]
EIAIKTSLGKLTLAAPFEELIPTQILETGVEVLPIQMNHLTKLVSLPFHHRDPFDRLLAAQALAEGIQLISVDKVFSAYSVQSLW